MTEHPPPYTASRVRKNMDMDARKLAKAQRALGARSETETVDLALDYVVFQAEVGAALDHLAAIGGLDDPFDAPRQRRVAEPTHAREPRKAKKPKRG